MRIYSPEFDHQALIPEKFTCDGANVNPRLNIDDIPREAKSLALIIEDPDAPLHTFTHWLVYDIPVVSVIAENSVPGKQGVNDFHRQDYGGPCPPRGRHRYFFKIFALNQVLDLDEGENKTIVMKKMRKITIDQAEMVGLYESHS